MFRSLGPQTKSQVSSFSRCWDMYRVHHWRNVPQFPPSLWEDKDLRVTQRRNVHPKQHLDLFSRYCTMKPNWVAWQTDWLTDTALIGNICLHMHSMQPKIHKKCLIRICILRTHVHLVRPPVGALSHQATAPIRCHLRHITLAFVCRLFTEAEVEEIRATTVKKVILAVTNIPEDAIQDNPFFLNGSFS